MKGKSWLIIIVVAVLLVALFGSCSGNGHAPGYGNTSKCTICGKAATHHSTNYGFCDKHWKNVIGG